jgi:hypothetical protein
MYETKPTELWRERQLALMREARDQRLARRLRKAHLKRGSGSTNEGRPAGLRRVTALWK